MFDPFLNGIFDTSATMNDAVIHGIFDEEFQNILEAEGRTITFTVSLDAAHDIEHGQILEIGNRQFQVIGLRPVDDGLYVDLVLKELNPQTPINDIPEFFLNGVFDSLATLGTKAVRGIFDEEFENILEAEGRRLTFTVDLNTALDTHHGTRLELGNRQFKVIGIEPIDDGLYTDLILQELKALPNLVFVNIQPLDDILKAIFVNVQPIDDMPGIQYLTINKNVISINNQLVILGGVF